MRKNTKRALTLLLSAALLAVQLPAAVMAGEQEQGPKEGQIVSFEELDPSVKDQSVILWTELEELELPGAVAAYVYHEGTEASGEDGQEASDGTGQAASGETRQEIRQEDALKAQTQVSGNEAEGITDSAPQTLQGKTERIEIPVTWESTPSYNPNKVGSYTFRASAEGYVPAEGTEWPVITVRTYTTGSRTINDGYDVDGLHYKEVGPGEVQLTGPSPLMNPTGTITVPAEITAAGGKRFQVTSVGTGAFERMSIRGLVLPEGLKEIGKKAFSDCQSLTGTVAIPGTVESIGDFAFLGTGITGVSLPEGLKSIGGFAFACQSLRGTVTIPSTVESIGDYAFEGSGITGVSLPEGLKSIGDSAFSACQSLRGTVTIPSTVESIGIYAFQRTGITGVSLQEGLKSIGDFAFNNCFSLRGTVAIPSTVESIGDYAFAYSGITGLSLPEGLKGIGNAAFSDCQSLRGTVTIPGTVESIGEAAFFRSGITGLSLQEGLKSIGDLAFYDCQSLRSPVTVPSTVASIGRDAFSGTGIASFQAGNDRVAGLLRESGIDEGKISLTSGGAVAFPERFQEGDLKYTVTGPDTVALTGYTGDPAVVAIPEQAFYQGVTYRVTSIGENAFLNSGITGVNLPEGLKSIGDSAFNNCSSLTGTVAIPGTVESIGDSAFSSSGITGVNLPEGLKSIGDEAFNSCRSLTGTVTVPGTVESIGDSAFYRSGITGLNLTEGLRSIGKMAFMFCQNLTGTVTIPSTMETIDDSAFAASGITGLILREGLKSIEGTAFYGCQNLTAPVTIPGTVESIGTSAFSGSGITEFNLPEGLKSIGDYAFMDCQNLTVPVTIPASVTEIGAEAFWDSGITEAHIKGSLTGVGARAFPENIPIHCDDPATQLLVVRAMNMTQTPTASWDGVKDIPAGAVVTVKDNTAVTGSVGAERGVEASIPGGDAMSVESGGELSVRTGALLTVRGGGALLIEDGGTLLIEDGGTLLIEDGAAVDGAGKIIVYPGGRIIGEVGGGLTVVYMVSGVSLDRTSLTLFLDQEPGSVVLRATVEPEKATDKTVRFSSSNPGVAQVDEGGRVRAVSEGSAVVSATTADGAYRAECAVTVKYGKEPSLAKDPTVVMPKDHYLLPGDNISVTIPRGDLSLLADYKKTLTIEGRSLRMSFGPAALRAILAATAGASDGKATFSAAPADLKAFPQASKAIGTRPAYYFLISVRDLLGTVTPVNPLFPTGSATVSLSYTPAKGESPEGLFLTHVDATGTVTNLNGSGYFAAPAGSQAESAFGTTVGSVLGAAPRFSVYGVAYKAPGNTYSDLQNHPAGEAVEFVTARGLLTETAAKGSTLFHPESPVTRGEYITALARLTGIDPSLYPLRSFSDLKPDSEAAACAQWALQTGIIRTNAAAAGVESLLSGSGAGPFGPDTPITKEELYTLSARYAAQTDRALPAALATAKALPASSTPVGSTQVQPSIATRAEAAVTLRLLAQTLLIPAPPADK